MASDDGQVPYVSWPLAATAYAGGSAAVRMRQTVVLGSGENDMVGGKKMINNLMGPGRVGEGSRGSRNVDRSGQECRRRKRRRR